MSDNPRIEDLRRRIQRDPASIAFAQLAEEHRRLGQFEDAVSVCRAGLALHPTYLSARVTLGRSLVELGELDAAQHELQLVLATAPDNLAATRALAEVHHRKGGLAEALAQYRRALGLARNDPDLQQTVADLTRELARTPAPAPPISQAPPVDTGELLSLEQLAAELQLNALSPEPRVPASSLAASAAEARPDSRSVADSPVEVQAVALLERWLTAIDGYRADRSA